MRAAARSWRRAAPCACGCDGLLCALALLHSLGGAGGVGHESDDAHQGELGGDAVAATSFGGEQGLRGV